MSRGPNSGRAITLTVSQQMRAQKSLRSKATICEDGCWRYLRPGWEFSIPSMMIDGRLLKGSRLSYAAFKGPIKEARLVRHSCDNHECFNPEHLTLGTQADNMRDREDRGRANRRTKSSPEKKWLLKQISEVRDRFGWDPYWGPRDRLVRLLALWEAEGTRKESLVRLSSADPDLYALHDQIIEALAEEHGLEPERVPLPELPPSPSAFPASQGPSVAAPPGWRG
jgi:hypothetical protein